MSKGIDPTMIGLLAAGGYGVYAYSKGMWPFSSAVAAAPILPTSVLPKVAAAVPFNPRNQDEGPSGPPVPPVTNTLIRGPIICPQGQYSYNDVCVPIGATCPTGQTTGADGKCHTAITLTTLQKVSALGGEGARLNTDQWCWYYGQATGNQCGDPGNLTPDQFAAAGLVDRTTPTDVNTWWNLMSSNLGLSGLGSVVSDFGSWGVAAAAALAFFLFKGGR